MKYLVFLFAIAIFISCNESDSKKESNDEKENKENVENNIAEELTLEEQMIGRWKLSNRGDEVAEDEIYLNLNEDFTFRYDTEEFKSHGVWYVKDGCLESDWDGFIDYYGKITSVDEKTMILEDTIIIQATETTDREEKVVEMIYEKCEETE